MGMISASILQRLSALGMSGEAFQEVLSIIAEIQTAIDTRREGQRLRTRKHRAKALQARYCNVTVTQEKSPTPPKENISNLLTLLTNPSLPSSKDNLLSRLEIVAPASDWPKDFREQFWAAYPRKVGKAGALRVLERLRRDGKVKFPDLLAAVDRYRTASPDPQFIKHPETWLNKGCWDDHLDGASAIRSLEETRRILANGGQ